MTTPHDSAKRMGDLRHMVSLLEGLHDVERWAHNEADSTLVQILGPPIGHLKNLIAEAVIGDELKALRGRSKP